MTLATGRAQPLLAMLTRKHHCVMAITAADLDISFHREQGQSPSQREEKSHVRMYGAEEFGRIWQTS
jgi:hypothetical protein